jgi:hypothetical protein
MDTKNSTNKINTDDLKDSVQVRDLVDPREDIEDVYEGPGFCVFPIAPFNKYESGHPFFICRMPEFLKDV